MQLASEEPRDSKEMAVHALRLLTLGPPRQQRIITPFQAIPGVIGGNPNIG